MAILHTTMPCGATGYSDAPSRAGADAIVTMAAAGSIISRAPAPTAVAWNASGWRAS